MITPNTIIIMTNKLPTLALLLGLFPIGLQAQAHHMGGGSTINIVSVMNVEQVGAPTEVSRTDSYIEYAVDVRVSSNQTFQLMLTSNGSESNNLLLKNASGEYEALRPGHSVSVTKSIQAGRNRPAVIHYRHLLPVTEEGFASPEQASPTEFQYSLMTT